VYGQAMADFDVIYLYMRLQRIRCGALGLNVNSMSDVLFAGTSAVEFGATFNVADYYLRPHATLGARSFQEFTERRRHFRRNARRRRPVRHDLDVPGKPSQGSPPASI